MKYRLILFVYWVLSMINLFSPFLPSREFYQLTKPLLMPLLLYYIYRLSKGFVTARILLLSLAILLSWVGDVLLIYEGDNYFGAGIIFFLLAQVTYIVVLNRSTYQPLHFEFLKWLPFGIYAVGLFLWLSHDVGVVKVLVMAYGIILSFMAGIARLRKGNTTQRSYQWTLCGSFLFMIFHLLVTVNEYHYSTLLSDMGVTATYVIAQFFLTRGVLAHID